MPTPGRLSRAAVLQEAIALVDESGLAALTMRNLSERLGVVPMALYRHVANKEDLLAGAIDQFVATLPIPDPDLGWREGLSTLAHSIRNTLMQHPALVGPFMAQPTLGPNGLVVIEYAIGLLRDAGFTDDDAVHGEVSILTYTIGFAGLEVPRRAAGYQPDGSVVGALEIPFDDLPEQFRHVREVRPPLAAFVSDAQFEFGLQCILDGLERRLTRGRRR
jgi:AcrR family transcriptional regulator